MIIKKSLRIARDLKEPEHGAIGRLDANADILDYVLYQYLPDEIVNDNERYEEVRRFFLEDFGVIPHLA